MPYVSWRCSPKPRARRARSSSTPSTGPVLCSQSPLHDRSRPSRAGVPRLSAIVSVEQIVAFLGFAVVMAGTPGPSNTLLTATGGQVGVVRGLPALLGVAVGMGFMMFAVTFGLGALILDTPLLVNALKWAGALVLVWFAWKIGTSGSSHGAGETRPIGFVGAAAFQWINPKSWLACMSAAGTYLDPNRGSAAAQAAVLALLFVAAALPSCSVWLVSGRAVQRVLRTERAARVFNLVMAALLLGPVAPLVLT